MDTTWEQRAKRALDMAEWGSFDGAAHKAWAIDQVVRALTGCSEDGDTMRDDSPEYREWVERFNAGDNGPNTYSWGTGVAP